MSFHSNIFHHIRLLSPVHFWTYERDFLCQYCQAWVRLELDTHLAQQALREALDTKEVQEARERLNRITELSHVRLLKPEIKESEEWWGKNISSVCFSVLWQRIHQFFCVPAPWRGVEGRPLDYGLPAVRSVSAVGGGGTSWLGDGRRPTSMSRWWGGGGESDSQTDVASSDTSSETSHCRYNVDSIILVYVFQAIYN